MPKYNISFEYGLVTFKASSKLEAETKFKKKYDIKPKSITKVND